MNEKTEIDEDLIKSMIREKVERYRKTVPSISVEFLKRNEFAKEFKKNPLCCEGTKESCISCDEPVLPCFSKPLESQIVICPEMIIEKLKGEPEDLYFTIIEAVALWEIAYVSAWGLKPGDPREASENTIKKSWPFHYAVLKAIFGENALHEKNPQDI